MEYNYNFAKSLFEDYRWKNLYIENTQKCFKKHFEKNGNWGQNKTDSKKYGIIINGVWSWMNRINTHPNCLLSFIKWSLEEDKNFFIELGNPLYHKRNIEKLWSYLDENFELYFTEKIKKDYFNELKRKCNKSWATGNISNIAVILTFKKVFQGSYDYEYSFENGDGIDMDGVDITFTTIDGKVKTVQTKSGNYMNMGSEFYVNGSQNTLDYKTDYYSYVNVDSYHNQTSIIIFENNNELRKDKQGDIEIPKKLVIYNNHIENMSIPQIIQKIHESSLKLERSFTLTKDDENFVIIKDDEILVNIGNLDDPNLEKMLDQKFKELQQLLN